VAAAAVLPVLWRFAGGGRVPGAARLGRVEALDLGN
jgi:hypothetical protein